MEIPVHGQGRRTHRYGAFSLSCFCPSSVCVRFLSFYSRMVCLCLIFRTLWCKLFLSLLFLQTVFCFTSLSLSDETLSFWNRFRPFLRCVYIYIFRNTYAAHIRTHTNTHAPAQGTPRACFTSPCRPMGRLWFLLPGTRRCDSGSASLQTLRAATPASRPSPWRPASP